MGDPAGIGPEVIAKALARPSVRRLCRPVVIGSRPVMERTIRSLGLPLRLNAVSLDDSVLDRARGIALLDPLERPLGRFRIGRASAETGAAAVSFITTAVRLAEKGRIDAMVTGPINKEGINLAGYPYPGHTELLADLTHSREVGMMIIGGRLKVMFATTHVAIKQLPDALTVERVARAIRLAHRGLRELFGISRPTLGIAALNPHAGDGGLFGDEEVRLLQPAIQQARQLGIRASAPLPADTLLSRAAHGAFDGVVALYHDQGLIALKVLAFGRCVNVTIGLPLLRTSVDHGTAYDIAGKWLADPSSLIEAITLTAKLTTERRAP